MACLLSFKKYLSLLKALAREWEKNNHTESLDEYFMEVGWEAQDFYRRNPGLYGKSDDWVQENPFDIMNHNECPWMSPNLYGVRYEGGTPACQSPHLLSLALLLLLPFLWILNPVLTTLFPPWRPCQNVLPALHQTPSITGQGKPYPISCVLTPSIPTQHWCRT